MPKKPLKVKVVSRKTGKTNKKATKTLNANAKGFARSQKAQKGHKTSTVRTMAKKPAKGGNSSASVAARASAKVTLKRRNTGRGK